MRRMAWLKMAGALAGAALLGGLVTTRLTSSHSSVAQPPGIRAQRYILSDANGVQRAILEASPDGATRLNLLGQNNQTTLVSIAAVPHEGASVTLNDEGGVSRARMMIEPDGSATIGLVGARPGLVQAALRSDPDGRAGLQLRDQHDRLRASLSLAADGSPSLIFLDERGAQTPPFP